MSFAKKRTFVFEWDQKSLSVRVESMDHDHQRLIAMMNEIYNMYTKNASHSEQLEALTALGEFVVGHFAREEKYFEAQKHYQDAEIHKAIHKKLIKRYSDFLGEFKNGGKLSDEFFMFLKAWLIAHIEGVDSRYNPE